MRSEGGSQTSLAFLVCGETDLSLGHSALGGTDNSNSTCIGHILPGFERRLKGDVGS